MGEWYKLNKDDVPQFIDWLKSILALSSAGVGAIAFSLKSGVFIPTAFKWGVGFFFVSILLTLMSILIIIEHKRGKNNVLPKKSAFIIIFSFICFLAGMGSIAIYVLS